MTRRRTLILSPLRHIDVPAVDNASRIEARSRQRHLPPVSAYRWWARRTEAVTGAVLDAVAKDVPGRLVVADPFAGGGVIALAALLRGHQVYAQDVNPWAAASLSGMLTLPDASELNAAATRLHEAAARDLAAAYATTLRDGTPATIAHTLRVAIIDCVGCGEAVRLFPSAVVSLTERVDTGGADAWLACPAGHLQLGTADRRQRCRKCNRIIDPGARYLPERNYRCFRCGTTAKVFSVASTMRWEPVLVERTTPQSREIDAPRSAERTAAANETWPARHKLPMISNGIETRVLIRHGMKCWSDLYPARQVEMVRILLGQVGTASAGNPCVAAALRLAVLGSTEMAGYASRWDPGYLKAYEAVANHRYCFTTLAAEPNVWGASRSGRGTVDRRLEQFVKASMWLAERFGRRLVVDGPVSSKRRRTKLRRDIDARVVKGSSERLAMADGSLDLVLTDPPYHNDVHYGELSELFRAWAGLDVGPLEGEAVSANNGAEGTETYRKTLARVFYEIRRALRASGHLILSYANRHPDAWVALLSALQDAGFRAIGYEIVHSENELDHAKSGKRACTLDVLLDLVPAHVQVVRRHWPQWAPVSDEEEFCQLVGDTAIEVGSLRDGWETRFTNQLKATEFLS
jgi:putative DNA methylase